MLTSLLAAVIVSATSSAPIDQRFPEAVPLFACDFEATADADFDGWPDGWARKRGPGFPHYVEIRIAELAADTTMRGLRVACNGGAAAVFGPAISVGPRFAYVLEGRIRTSGLVRNSARLAIVFLDENRQPVEVFYSDAIGGTIDWTKFRIGPISPRSSAVRYAMVSGQVDVDETADLAGEVWFDDFWLARTPRLVVATSAPYGLYTDPAAVAIAGELSGLDSQDFTVACQLIDMTGVSIQRSEQALSLERVVEADLAMGTAEEFAGRFTWQPTVPGVGFYRVEVTATGRAGSLHRQSLPLLVVPDDEAAAGLEFGWSLPHGEGPVPLSDLPKLLVRFGVQRLKFPVWFAEDDARRAAELSTLAERLNNRQIELVGLLNNPPPAVREKFKSEAELLAIDVFGRSPDLWFPALEPVLGRLSMNIRYWQLGADSDTSLVATTNLAPRIDDIKSRLDGIGQNVHLGFGWDWQYDLPAVSTTGAGDRSQPWRFLSLATDPALTPAELSASLAGLSRKRGERWMSIRPLPAGHYGLNDRVADLVGQMVEAKCHGAEGIFLDDPFHNDHGLLDAQGRPTELLLAWRTTATMLAGASYAGPMALPQGGAAAVFERDRTALVYLPPGQATKQTLAWGAQAQQISPWGQVASLPREHDEQSAAVGPWPSFVDKVDLGPATWRAGVRIEPDRVPSVLGQPVSLKLMLRNTFSQAISGTAFVIGPESWRLETLPMPFDLPPGARIELPILFSLPHDATLGAHLLRIDFEINADQTYRISAYPHLTIGDDDVRIEVDSRLNERGQLEIEQRLINATDEDVTFKCFLLAPERRRLRRQVVEHHRGVDVQTYLLDDGALLVGQRLLLRAEEVGGPRTMNLLFTAER